MFRSRSTLTAFALICVFWGPVERSQAVEADARNAALASITTPEIKDLVGALADDTFEGRESGSRGNRAAGIYIIERLKKFGLQGGGPKGSFYQNFDSYHNILAIAPGRDPDVNNQVIVISAHYDHVGYGNARNSFGPTGLIHNGADDNASGVAALLEVAEAVSQLPVKPRRSILFAFWDGEEKGLLGSKHWIGHPTVPLDHVPIMMNADMVGRLRNSGLVIYGTRTSKGLRRLISRQNDTSQLLLDFSWEIKGDSDHYSFYSHDIPFVMMHTGLHNDYHRPSDDADKINTEGLKQIAQLMFGVVVELAEAPSLAGFRSQARSETRYDQQHSERALPPLPGRLGVRWDEKAAEAGKIVVTAVTPGSAADRAGLRPGDRLTKFAGSEITTIPEFRVRVLAAQSPVPAVIERTGTPEPIDVQLDLPGHPIRLGVSWRNDETETGCVILNRVTPGSPADVAGLRVNDRVHRINGQDFPDAEGFRRLVTDLNVDLALEVETGGRVRTVEIPRLESPPPSTALESVDQRASDPTP